MGYCTRCGAVVTTGDRCRCGGRSKASTTNALFGESSARDKWSQRYLSKSPNSSPTSTPPPQMFPIEQHPLPGAFPVTSNSKFVSTAPLNLHKRTKSLKAYQDHVDKIGTLAANEDTEGELNVFGNLLSPSDCWSCCSCEVKFKSEDTIYPDPRAKQDPKLADIFYCRQCFAQRFSLGDCKRCKCAVLSDSPFIKHGPNLLWHDTCFVCTYCSQAGTPSSSIIIDMAGAPSCESCFDAAAYETQGVPPSPHLSRTPSIISASGERRERKLSLRPAPSKWGSGSGSSAPPYISALQKREQDERDAVAEKEKKLLGIVEKKGMDSRSYQPSSRSLPLPKPPAPRPLSTSALASPSAAWSRTKKERDGSLMVGSFNELSEKLQKVGLGTGILTPRSTIDPSPRKSTVQPTRSASPTKPASTFSAPKSYGVVLPTPIRAERSPMTGAYPTEERRSGVTEERRTDASKPRPKSWHVPADKPIPSPVIAAKTGSRPLSVLERRQLFNIPSPESQAVPSPIRHTRNANSLSAFSAFAAPPKYPFPDTVTSSKKDPLPPSTFSSPASFLVRPRSKSVAFSAAVQKSPEVPWSAGKAALRSTALAPPQYVRAATTNSIPKIPAASSLLPKVPHSASSSHLSELASTEKKQWRPTSVGKSPITILKPASITVPSINSLVAIKPPPMSMKEKLAKEQAGETEPTHCGKCEKVLGYDGKFIQLDNRQEVFHQDCFRCGKCREVLEGGKYFEGEGGLVWHIHCAPTPTVHRVKVPVLAPESPKVAEKEAKSPQLGSCQSCNVGFEGGEEEKIVTTRTNRSFHQTCFRCTGCEGGFESLRGGQPTGFVEADGLPWHDRRAPTQRIALLPTIASLTPLRTSRSPSPASRPLPTIPQPSTPTTAAKTYQPPSIFSSPAKTTSFSPSPLLICPGCSLRIINAFGSLVGPKGKKYHALCLKCSACAKTLDSGAKELEAGDGILVCADCRGLGGRRLRR